MTKDSKAGQETDSSLAQADSCKLKPFDSSLLHLLANVNHSKQALSNRQSSLKRK